MDFSALVDSTGGIPQRGKSVVKDGDPCEIEDVISIFHNLTAVTKFQTMEELQRSYISNTVPPYLHKLSKIWNKRDHLNSDLSCGPPRGLRNML
ncbi:hypothetical protein KIN20_014515 [Parelaphostrongylus tenuis]|uniref:Uncharacterized protein n=1 Tax=Parelaphostrongylus tenuis TaxID=148309 RepID=A0AAD5MHA2_PARTN|nr:hypothetical protein KIN20_014515 [Parelaphostrongylus tenuis]